MTTYQINYDFGQTNLKSITDAIKDLNVGKDTEIIIFNNAGGSAQLAVDLTHAIIFSEAISIKIIVVGFAHSAAAFVVMSVYMYGSGNVNITFPEPISLMYHRPRQINPKTGLSYFDLHSEICIEYDKLMNKWIKRFEVSYNDQEAYYTNHEYVVIIK
ncbi:hypothetical protein N5923_21270 [Erwiniaceae bacterium BAC15a-03b]|uniref:Uncharacterized protein n=1 Tax=Winslowiella arboricola TaxID=2978220 RepID=A0A9J6PNZ7_9GAMM|nr:hypothetical protein [Winslowiella arboricola]MCU5774823.1 hypothetical protein [Winslowiella arboricola]MCU5780025.1 hypothetical protein [Winslowiella arboricola]